MHVIKHIFNYCKYLGEYFIKEAHFELVLKMAFNNNIQFIK